MSAIEELKKELFDNPNRTLLNMNIWWGPGAEDMTPEERAQVILDSIRSASHDERSDIEINSPPKTEKPKKHIKEFLNRLY